MSRYKVWDKKSKIFTPSGEVFTPEQWIERYPVAEVADIIVAGGVINGSIFAVYEQFIEMYSKEGCDFSSCTTQQEHLDAIETFEDARNAAAAEAANQPSTDERIAAALEYQVMASLPDETTETTKTA